MPLSTFLFHSLRTYLQQISTSLLCIVRLFCFWFQELHEWPLECTVCNPSKHSLIIYFCVFFWQVARSTQKKLKRCIICCCSQWSPFSWSLLRVSTVHVLCVSRSLQSGQFVIKTKTFPSQSRTTKRKRNKRRPRNNEQKSFFTRGEIEISVFHQTYPQLSHSQTPCQVSEASASTIIVSLFVILIILYQITVIWLNYNINWNNFPAKLNGMKSHSHKNNERGSFQDCFGFAWGGRKKS